MKLYLAGPMTGIPQFNYPRFEYVAGELRTEGHEVLNPAEMDDPKTRELALASKDGSVGSGVWNGDTWGDCLARDVKIVADEVDGVVLLEGWKESRGARLEAFVALSALKPVFLWSDSCGIQAATPEYIMHFIQYFTINRDTDKERLYG